MRINGNVVLNSDASGEIQHLYVERLATAPAISALQKGRLYFNTTTSLFYFNDGSAWQPLATGGNAGALQQQLDNLIASVGASVATDGTWQGAVAFNGDAILEDAETITDALLLLSAASSSKDSLAELNDVSLGSLASGQFLQYNGVAWANKTLVLADVTDVTATAAEVNVLDGIVATTNELNYVSGVTSSIQDQLDAKQDESASLTALSNLAGNGVVVQTGANTFANRSLSAPAEGLSITNADGVSGNITFTLENDLAAIEDLTTTGFIVRNANDSAVTRSISGTADRITVVNGDGVVGSPTIDLAEVVQGSSSNFVKVSVDSYGRVTGTTAIVEADITALVDSVYVNASGDTVTGNLVFSGATVTGLPNPVNGTDAANKNYVDASVTGLTWKNAVDILANTNLLITDTFGIGDDVGGVLIDVGTRILLTNQTTSTENGIYVFVADGADLALERASDADAFAELNGATVFVKAGDFADTGWTQTAELTSFAGQVWVQFTGAGTYSAGIGLSLAGNTFNVNLGAGIAQLPSDEVGLDIRAGGALILTTDGVNPSTDGAAALHLLVKNDGLVQDATGLGLEDGGIANVKLENSSFTIDVDGAGTTSVSLGGNLDIFGDATQGISTSVTGSTITVTAANASSSQKGVASFDGVEFTVTAGDVELRTGGIANDKLVNSSITVDGNTGSTSVALGDTFVIEGDGAVSVAAGIGSVLVSVADATSSIKGVASFNSADFTVTSGAVSLNALDLSDLTDVDTSGVAAGDTLVYNSTTSQFEAKKTFHVYTGTSSTSHVVNHNIGQQYCNVTVVDDTDEVVIPESITFNSSNQLTVTFTSAIACKVVVSGVPVA